MPAPLPLAASALAGVLGTPLAQASADFPPGPRAQTAIIAI